MTTALITGITGQDGSYLAEFLVYFYLLKRSQFAFSLLNNIKASLAVAVAP